MLAPLDLSEEVQEQQEVKEPPGTFFSMRDLFKNGDIPVRDQCLRRLHVRDQDKLGSGHFGAVYLAKNESGRKSVLKFFGSMAKKKVQRELDLSTKAGKLGVGPEVYEAWICPAEKNPNVFVGMIDMELFTGTLRNWSKEVAKNSEITKKQKQIKISRIRGTLSSLLETLHCHNIAHNDLHSGNVLVSYTADTPLATKMVLSDFGLATKIDKKISNAAKTDLFGKDWDDLDSLINELTKEML